MNKTHWIKSGLCGVLLSAMIGGSVQAEVLETATGNAPLIFTTMTHTDGTTEDSNQTLYLSEVGELRAAMGLFDQYGVKMTLEASSDFATANTNWRVNILQEFVDGGHGVGTHVNGIGGSQARESTISYSRKITATKRLVDNLVDSTNNVTCSGIGGRSDWAAAAAFSRCAAVDAITGLSYLSMSLANRPLGWSDSAILSTYFHDPAPVDLEDRIYPFYVSNALDFVADTNGTILLSTGEIGELASLSEGYDSCGASCSLDEDDFDVVYNAIDTVLAIKDAGRVAKLDVHIPMKLLDAENEALMRSFLAGLKSYADAGLIVFGTQKDVVDTVGAWR